MLITLLAILILSLVVQAWGWWAVQLFSFRSAQLSYIMDLGPSGRLYRYPALYVLGQKETWMGLDKLAISF